MTQKEIPVSGSLEFYRSMHAVTPKEIVSGEYATSLDGSSKLRLIWHAYSPFPYHIFAPAGAKNEAGIFELDDNQLQKYADAQNAGINMSRGWLLDFRGEGADTVCEFGFAYGVRDHELVLGSAFEAGFSGEQLIQTGSMQLNLNVFGETQAFSCTTEHTEGVCNIEMFASSLSVSKAAFTGKSYMIVRALSRLLPTAARIAAGDIWSPSTEVSYTLHAGTEILDSFGPYG